MKDTLVLFDIDGTLIKFDKSSLLHERFSFAVNKTFNCDLRTDMIDINGKPFERIMTELSKLAGTKHGDALKAMPRLLKLEKAYVIKRSKIYRNNPTKGAISLLKRLRQGGYPMGLITGNSEFVSWFKIRKANMKSFFSFGTFGEDSEHREDLVVWAIKKANKKFKKNFNAKNVFYFGDAPLDIIAGRMAGVNVIAVATGKCSVSELKEYKPDYVLKDLSDLEKVMRIISKND